MYPLSQYEVSSFSANSPANSRQATSLLLERLREGVLPPVAALSALGLDALSCVLQRRGGATPAPHLAHRYMEALANNLPLRRTLKEAAKALSAAGIPVIVYKGQDYLERIYGDLGARSMADVDLLVREADLAAAERALIAAGFIGDAECKLMHERKFCKDGVAIDLHHALLQQARMRIDHDELFARATPSPVGCGLLALEATDAFLVHCINQTVKGYSLPASSYLELQALMARADMTQALRRAARYQMLAALYTSLAALGELGHAGAARWAERVPLPKRRRLALCAVTLRFALGAIARETPSRGTMLALKATLIDDPLAIVCFVPTWAFWQTPLKAPRELARARDNGELDATTRSRAA